MTLSSTFTLIDPQNGNLAFKLFTFDDGSTFDHIQRLNYYSLIWVQEGKGNAKVETTQFDFNANTLFSFVPYQPFMLKAEKEFKGVVINFHPDFFCIHKHHKEVACHGVLFNNVYNPPCISLDETAANTFSTLIDQMKTEMKHPALAQYELLVSYLKIFLINASRLKKVQQPETIATTAEQKEPFILQNLKDAIEKDFKTKHSASDYAEALNISAKALAKITKNYFNKTLTDLIAERIIIEAKRELYLTSKTVKEIAHGLGYQDEYYFSRFFKANADVSPQLYRETVGFARAEV
ncbi:MAG: helix-turn-helix domain-containing protein [Bacteroidia bacterium]|nr:helix-turn-helix domain-containing protein [Bacteroidota bacterium]MBP6511267.1 helix-turn-helix domain-containing protein [Bacteroidia bacterium]MBP7243970.1 helix-turn-helix domain-containing protein [Bacteroidia bacterium]